MAIQKLEHPMFDYQKKTSSSKEFMNEAAQVMPGGVTANIKYFEPYPIVMKYGKGAKLIDMDNQEYIDYLMSYGSLVTGHGHNEVKKAVIEQMERDGTWLFGTPHSLEVEMGKRLQQHFPSMELLRYTNSGTEATLLALRIAAAHTGKHKIAKFEGHYHGGYDQMLVSVSPPVHQAGDPESPESLPDSKGMSTSHLRNTIVLPFNDAKACKRILHEHKDEIGAVMIEPIQAGFIPADPSFLKGLRQVTEELGMVLIFDEVKTGYRTCLGGAQHIYDVKPDLTTLGKAIGGGYPIGVVGGKKEIMMHSSPVEGADVFDSSQTKSGTAKDVLFHSGTYNGHPMILAAGMAVIDILERELESTLRKTEQLKTGMNELLKKYKVKGQTVGTGSIFSVVLSNMKIRNYRDLQKTDLATRKELDFSLFRKGIYMKPVNRYSVSTAHTKEDIENTLDAFEKALQEVYGGSRF
ncbi:aspartate aminotransferase family protein [Alteribacillus iranensis]|uniref:Glutamate-1-semialdehyde 2,1-aminomutase n=1 Tax=Alteribacillus iranensis TaxID=930128 RepID=A0A1I2CVY8_9BACI|nr:aspartate aminotransferase family protein [Alteribacillus iranensis]SFE72497.1 glutamate-1-semialdehyde 2,1-aminomutase [Alteribacillus iranensis]